ncbi:MAG: fibronectin type III domain-containing protein [Clostridia bacterium]|nr:fibronectin type III domain-containing protein [Clostridia bacterium]
MKNRKRLLSIVLTLCMILTMMPMTVNAASTVNHIELNGAPDKYEIGKTVKDAPVGAISVKSGNVDCMARMWINTSTATPSQSSDLGEPLTEDTVFDAFDSSNPKYYFVAVTVMADAGYELADDMTATVNGVDATVIMLYADGVKKGAVVLLPYDSETGKLVTNPTDPTTPDNTSKPEKKTLDSASVKLSAVSYAYTGSYKTPAVTVTDGTYKLVKGTDYEVTYSSNKYVGTAKVTIKGIGDYEGEIVKTFKINPSKVTLSKVSKSASGKFKATWKKHSTQTTGFQIRYSTSSTFKTYKTVTVSGKSAVSKTVSKLKKGKKYYVKVRAYKTVNGTRYYGSWSAVKSVRV